MDTLLEFSGFHFVGLNNWFEVNCGWSYKLGKGVLYCDTSKRVDGVADKPFESRIITCSSSAQGEVEQAVNDCLVYYNMEGSSFSIESRGWIVDFNGELYAACFNETREPGKVLYSVKRMMKTVSERLACLDDIRSDGWKTEVQELVDQFLVKKGVIDKTRNSIRRMQKTAFKKLAHVGDDAHHDKNKMAIQGLIDKFLVRTGTIKISIKNRDELLKFTEELIDLNF